MAKGLYTPLNPQKYMGDPNKIRFLSSWELRFMVFLDSNPNVISWGSEEFKIPYFNPIKKKVCNYIPDFIFKYRDATGKEITEVIEIKPRVQSVITGKKVSTYDQVQLVLNNAKWTAAKAICDEAGIRFRVITEMDIFKQKPQKPTKRKNNG